MTALFKKGFLALALFSFLLASSCTKEPEAPLRVGTNVWSGYEPFYIADDLRFYGDTAVRLVEYPSATEVIRAFRNGFLEAAALTLEGVMLENRLISNGVEVSTLIEDRPLRGLE